MIEIELKQLPNQQFGLEVDGNRYIIKIRTFQGMTLMDVTLNDEKKCTSVRCCPNAVIIPYPRLTRDGNFMFICQNNTYPNWELFGVTQRFCYLTNEEIGMLNNAE